PSPSETATAPEFTDRLRVGMPSRLRKSAAKEPVALRLNDVPPATGDEVALTWTLCTSGCEKLALKLLVAFWVGSEFCWLCRASMIAAASRAACMAVRAALPRL